MTLELALLGPLRVRAEEGPISLPTAATRWLLARLVTEGGPQPRDELARTLWPEQRQSAASTNLRQTIARLRRAVPHCEDVLDVTRHEVAVRAGSVVADVHLVAELLDLPASGDAAVDHRHAPDALCPECVARLRSAVQLYAGEFCSGLYLSHSPSAEEWLAEMRAVWRRRMAASLDRLSATAARSGNHQAALADARQILDAEPLRDDAHERVMRSLVALGDRVEAARHYQAYRSTLVRELGLPPSPTMAALYDRLVHGTSPSRRPGPPNRHQAPSRSATAPLVGRDGEVRVLRKAVEEARRGYGPVVLVSGEPGIGKTRLVSSLLVDLADVTTLVGGCDEDEQSPYAPFAELLDADLLARDDPALRRVTGAGVEALAAMTSNPRLRALARLERPAPSAGPTSWSERDALLQAYSGWIRRLTKERPVVLVVEDLQWAPTSTLVLLRHLARTCRNARLLLVVTYRSHDLPDEVRAAVAALRRHPRAHDLPLSGLSEEDVVALAEHLAVPNPEHTGRQVYRRSGGNPLLRPRAARMAATHLSAAEEAVPAPVLDVVRARSLRLPATTREVLVSAAVLGQSFEADLVAIVSGLDGNTVLEALDRAGRAAFVRVVEPPGRWMFVHALVRDAQLAALPVAERTQRHAQVVQRLLGADRRDPRPAQLVRHVLAGGPLVTDEIRVEACRRAGDQARDALAFEEAVGYYQAALDALEGCRDEIRPTRCDLLVSLGGVLRRSGAPEYRDRLLDAAALAYRLGDAERMCDALLAVAPAGLGTQFGRPDAVFADLAGRALAQLSSAQIARRARLTALLAADLSFSRQHRRAAEVSRNAVCLARRADEPATLAFVLIRHFWVAYDPDNPRERLSTLDETISLAALDDDLELELYARSCRSDVMVELGDVDSMLAEIEVIEARAARVGQPFSSWLALEKRSGLALLRGDLTRGSDLSAAAIRVAEGSASPAPGAIRMAQRAIIAEGRGRAATVIPVVRSAVEVMPGFPAWVALLAQLHCEVGQRAKARAVFETLARHDFADLPRNNTWRSAMHCAAAVAVGLGDRDRAAILYRLLLPSAGLVEWFGGGSFGPTDLVLGRLAIVLGDDAAARTHFEAAVALCRRIEATGYLAEALRRLADLDPSAPDSRAVLTQAEE